MRSNFLVKILTIFLLLVTVSASAFQEKKHEESGSKKETKQEIKEFIKHHLKDSHDFGITSYTADNGKSERSDKLEINQKGLIVHWKRLSLTMACDMDLCSGSKTILQIGVQIGWTPLKHL